MIGKAVEFLADAAVDSVKASAKTGALINLARRAIWVKAWEGKLTTKAKLSGLLFKGSLLFGSGLDDVLSRSSEKGKTFSVKPKREKYKKFFSRPFDTKSTKVQEGTQQKVGLW